MKCIISVDNKYIKRVTNEKAKERLKKIQNEANQGTKQLARKKGGAF